MKGDREAIFGRIREALKEPAPRHHEKPTAAHSSAVTAAFREWLPPVGDPVQERIDLFARISEVLRTEFVVCADMAAAVDHLRGLIAAHSWTALASHAGELTVQLTAELPDTVSLLMVDTGYPKEAMERCDAGITECECLLAQTGSVCVTTKSSGGRALSVLPPHHLVIARRSQLLPDLTAAYELLAEKYGASGYPSFMGFINGPSRTGDIERILVLGAHGPKKLTVLLVP